MPDVLHLFPVPEEEASPVDTIFDHWVEITWPKRGPRPRLTDQRRRAIKRALKDYKPQDCLDAIDGIMLSDFHTGHNSSGKRYLDIGLILRDAEHIERFAMMKHEEGDLW